MATMAESGVLAGGGLPLPVAEGLDRFVKSARAVLGDSLRSVVLFGSAVEGKLRTTSDVNLLLVLSAWDDRADALREPLRSAQAAIGLSPMFVLERELAAAALAFPVKFADIQRRRRVLYGADPFTVDLVPREAEIAHLGQVLLNTVLRLRERYLMASLRDEQAARALAEAAGPLRSTAASILELEGKPAPSPKEALARIAAEVPGAWDELLQDVSAAREGKPLPSGTAPASLRKLSALAEALLARARSLR
jgi:predicted nucleotidyltransferase